LKGFGNGYHTDLRAFVVNQADFWRSNFFIDSLVFTANRSFSLSSLTSVAGWQTRTIT
jgi:hypothetical protein